MIKYLKWGQKTLFEKKFQMDSSDDESVNLSQCEPAAPRSPPKASESVLQSDSDSDAPLAHNPLVSISDDSDSGKPDSPRLQNPQNVQNSEDEKAPSDAEKSNSNSDSDSGKILWT